MRAPEVSVTAGGALALVGVVAAVALLWKFGGKDEHGDSGAARAGAAVGRAAGDAAAGVVLGVGDSVGLPRTEQTACQAALAAGDLWHASFVCPAGDFLGGAWDKVKTTIDGKAIDPALPNTGGAAGSW